METKHPTKSTPLYIPQVEVKASPIHGYGVFATKNYVEGEIIEEAPALFFNSTSRFPEIVYDRVFYVGNGYSCIPLGYGAVYNHSDSYNAVYEFERQANFFRVTADKPIQPGEEILISYGEMYFKSRAQKMLVKFRNNERLRRFVKPAIAFAIVLIFAYILRT